MNNMIPKYRRRGFTLIETVFVVGAESLVAALAIGVLLLVTETRIKEQRGDRAQSAAPKIAQQFRSDIHEADTATLDGESLIMTLSDGGQVRYTVETNKLLRVKTVRDKRTAMESFALPDHTTAWFVRGEGRFDGLFALNLWTAPVDRRDQVLLSMPDRKSLDPFTRDCPTQEGGLHFDPRYAGNWRTILGKLSTNR